MASSVCDRTPCDFMQSAIDALVTFSYAPDRFSIKVQAQVNPKVFFLVQLKYCPFCGMRIEPSWAKNFYRPLERSTRP